MQVTYGLATATEIAYYTYIYSKVEPEHFQRVTSWTRVAILCGRFLSGVLAQTLTSYELLNYRQLNYLTLVSVSLSTVVAFALPAVDKTLYFYKDRQEELTSSVHLKTIEKGKEKLYMKHTMGG